MRGYNNGSTIEGKDAPNIIHRGEGQKEGRTEGQFVRVEGGEKALLKQKVKYMSLILQDRMIHQEKESNPDLADEMSSWRLEHPRGRPSVTVCSQQELYDE